MATTYNGDHMKTHVRLCSLLCFLIGATSPLLAQTYIDTFDDGSRSDGNPSSWVTTTASNLTVVYDSGLNSYALSASGGNGLYYGTTLPTAFSLSTTSVLTLSLDFRLTGLQQFRIGLCNNAGSALPATDSASLGTSAYQAIYLDIGADSYTAPTQIKYQVNGDGGLNGNLFFGTDRIFGSTLTTSGTLGTTVHNLKMTVQLSSSTTALMNLYLDSVLVDTQTLSTTTLQSLIGANGVTSLMVLIPGQTGASGDVLLDNISITVPEPSVALLLVSSCVFLVLGRSRRFLLSKPSECTVSMS
ncbi:MAG: hypothetical protein B9S32_01890 [Verrucomicrobia bacterium Tous-C9LFEB]|nr:MAG: hypothetical protein B9S32_01890 [Verrucomicrobia bacterium Tous-C9LFEB]